jgi:carbon storage regulator CsrA
MLVLSRKPNETIRITVPPSTTPQVIEVVVVEMRGAKVRIGTQADRSIKVDRAEIADLITASTQSSP